MTAFSARFFAFPFILTVLKTKEKIILGIDPGTNILGYSVIKVSGGKITVVANGIIRLRGYLDQYMKLKQIFTRVQNVIKEYGPEELAVEAPFFGKNVQSMLKLGRAQGVAISAALMMDLPIFEYSPKKIKQSITGNGNASKEQVAKMLQTIAGLDELPEYLDETDALATAVCHHYQSKFIAKGGSSFSGWKAFVQANPDRVSGK